MPAVHDITRASRARKVRFMLPGGVEVTVDPPSLDRVIECLALDPARDAAETPLEELRRLRRQAQALIGPAQIAPFAGLDQWQIGQVVSTLYVAACGLDAEAYAQWQLAQRLAQTRVDQLEMIENLERMSADLAAVLRKLPADVGAQPLADLIALQGSLARERDAERRFEASIHGCTLG